MSKVKNRILGLRDHAGYTAAVEKLDQLQQRRVAAQAAVDRLAAEWRDCKVNRFKREVDAALSDSPTSVATQSVQEELTATRRAVEILDAAIVAQRHVVEMQRGEASTEICTACIDAHRQIVAALDEALRRVDEIALAEIAFREELDRDGVRLVQPMTVARPHFLFAGPGRDLKSNYWRASMQAAGYLSEDNDHA